MARITVDPDEAIAAEKLERLPGYKWEELRQQAFERDNNKCVECSKPATDVDHILPMSLGGTNELNNLQSLCVDCHKEKTKNDNAKVSRMRKIKKYKRRIGGFD